MKLLCPLVHGEYFLPGTSTEGVNNLQMITGEMKWRIKTMTLPSLCNNSIVGLLWALHWFSLLHLWSKYCAFS